MAVVISRDAPGPEKTSLTVNDKGKEIRKHTQPRVIESKSICLYNYELLQALPYRYGDPHPSDSAALLENIDIERRMSMATGAANGPSNVWDVTLVYSTDAIPGEESDDPTLARVKPSWTTSSQTLYAVKDRHGNLITNTANQPFEGGVPVSVEMPTLTYERNENSFDGGIATSYANALNADTFSGAAPGTLRLKISATKTWQGIYIYWAVKYEMAYFHLGWQPKPINAGLYQLKAGKLVKCRDKELQEATTPMPLDLAGLQIPSTSLPGSALFVDVDYFQTMNFRSLGLPE